MGGNVVKEFLVSLGIKLDETGFKRMSSALNGTSDQLENLSDSVNGLQGDLKKTTEEGKKSSEEGKKQATGLQKSLLLLQTTFGKIGESIQKVGKVFTTVLKAITTGVKMVTNAISGIFGFIGGVVKACVSPLAKAVEGIKTGFKHLVLLAKEDLAFQTLARKMMLPLKVARRMTIALETLGASIEDIHLNPELFQNYKQLMEDSKTFENSLDFKEQMKSMRALMFEFSRLRQYFRYSAYAIADGFLRAFGIPLKKITEWFNGLNKNLIGNFHKISATVERYTKPISDFFVILFKEGKKALEGLGTNTKGVVKDIVEMFTTAKNPIALLLGMLEDFNIWHEGGESVFGPFWEWLINIIKNTYNEWKEKIEGFFTDLKEMWKKVKGVFDGSNEGLNKLLTSLDKIADSLQKIAGLAGGVGSIFKDFGNIFGGGEKEARAVDETDNIESIQNKLLNEKYIKDKKDFNIFKKYFETKKYLDKTNIGSFQYDALNTTLSQYKQDLEKAGYTQDTIDNVEQQYNALNIEARKQNAERNKKIIRDSQFEKNLSPYEDIIQQEIANVNKTHVYKINENDIKALIRVENAKVDKTAKNNNYIYSSKPREGFVYDSKIGKYKKLDSTDVGIMQINNVANGQNIKDLEDPKYNLQFGIKKFADLLTYYKGNKDLAFRAYNRGQGAIDENPNLGEEYLQKIKNTGYYNYEKKRNPFAMPAFISATDTSSQVKPQYFTPFIQAQSNDISCGQSSVAMTINALTGKRLTDNDINNRYGFSLLGALNGETKNNGFSWTDSGDFDSSRWGEIEEKLKKGLPVIMGMNGANFSPSGRGHIVALTSIDGDKVTIADPNGGRERIVSKRDIENAKGYPQGQFMFTATASDPNYNKPFIANPKTKREGTSYGHNAIQKGMRNSAVVANALTGQSGSYQSGTNLNNILNINGGININVKTNASPQEIAKAVKNTLDDKTKFIQKGRSTAQVMAV